MSVASMHRRRDWTLTTRGRRVNRDNPRRRRLIEAALKSPAEEPRFSVIVPVYNPPIALFRAMIRSVLDQTVADWELVLVNNASRDARCDRSWRTGRAADRRKSA